MKKLVLLFVAFAGLTAFVYFYEIKGGEEREAAEEAEKSLINVESDQISALQLEVAGQEPIVIGREGPEWLITQPVYSSTDRFAVDALTRELANASKTRTFEQGAEDAAQYGLEQPRVVVKITKKDGRQQTLKLGAEDYTKTQVYAQFEGDEAVHLVPKALFSAANKKLRELRSKSVLDFDQDLVKIVEIDRPDDKLRLSRNGEQWSLESPLEDRGDDSAVSSFLSSIKYARIDQFVAETDEDLAAYGLDQPQYSVRIRQGGDDSWRELHLGAAKGDGFYARNPGRPVIFTVRKDLVEKLQQKPWDFRDKRVVDVKQDDWDRFELKRSDETIVVRREGGAFTITAPEEQKGENTPPYKFWYPISDAKFESIEKGKSPPDDPRFASPFATLEITLNDGGTKSFEFVEKDGKYLARQVQAGRAGEISKTAFDKVKYKAESITSTTGG